MSDSSKILIVGIDSTLGYMAARHFDAKGRSWIGTSRRRQNPKHLFLDLSLDIRRWEIPDDVSVACIFAGVTRIQECEREPIRSRRVNVDGTIALARRLVARDIFVLFPSSNYVFDGSVADTLADAPRLPMTEYGRHQKDVEDALAAFADRVAILRMSKVLMAGFPLFEGWTADLRMGRPITPFKDLWMAPVTARDVMDVMTGIFDRRIPGTFQMSGLRDISYSDAAYHLADRLGAARHLVQPILGVDQGIHPMVVRRHNTLDCALTREFLGFERPEPQDVLDVVLGHADRRTRRSPDGDHPTLVRL